MPAIQLVPESVMRRAGFNSRGTILTRSSKFVWNGGILYIHLKREVTKVGLQVDASKPQVGSPAKQC